VVHVATTGL